MTYSSLSGGCLDQKMAGFASSKRAGRGGIASGRVANQFPP